MMKKGSIFSKEKVISQKQLSLLIDKYYMKI